jgi:hypothetical protein
VHGFAPDALVNAAMDRCRPDGTGGVVVVTRFDCPTYRHLLVIRLMHAVLGRRIRPKLDGLVLSYTRTQVRARRVLSVSVFGQIGDLYQMGQVTTHVNAARIPQKLGVKTSGGVFVYSGDWRKILFDAGTDSVSPLTDLPPPR